MQNRKYALRFNLVYLFLIVCLLIFGVKLILIQVYSSSHLTSIAQKQHNYFVELESVRGTIFDRKLKPLAFNVPVYSLFANPRSMSKEDKQKALKSLPQLLNLDPSFVAERLAKDKYFIWIKRKCSLEVTEQIKKAQIKGLGFRRESKRHYPNASLAAHIIGFAGVDNNGLEGLELSYNKYLKGREGHMQVLRDAHQRELMVGKSFTPPQDGFHLVLTIDETIQFLAERALDKAMEKYSAKSATVIVIDVKTGEILALVNRPTYNLQEFNKSTLESRTNRAISYVYEPGSIFKIVTAAAALEEGAFSEKDTIFCENGSYRIGRHTLTDHSSHGNISFSEVFGVSSNIGVVKIAEKLGAKTIYKYADRFRFGKKTNIDLHGEVNGWLKNPPKWSKTTIGAIPIGYEITATPLQLIGALSAVANQGVYMKPFVVKYVQNNEGKEVKTFKPKIVDRVISVDTAKRVTKILQGVVDEGTGKRARIEGIAVAGKTGTARKVQNGKYVQGKYYASFMGFAPADDPRLAAIVVVDEPRPQYFGGTVSAPVFKEIIENSLKYLGVTE